MKGLWLGIICALVVQVICLSLVTVFTNWDEEVRIKLCCSLTVLPIIYDNSVILMDRPRKQQKESSLLQV